MKLGFIGTGVITEAIITGLLRTDFPVSEVAVSRRGKATSTRLAAQHDKVRVCDDNQEIADAADVLFLAVRPQIAEEVAAPLRVHAGQQVASLIAGLPIEKLRSWLGPTAVVTRAIPLPSVAERCGVTAIYPESATVADLFGALGTVVTAETLDEFDAYAVAAGLMGTYFGILDGAARWMIRQGAEPDRARAYLTELFLGLARTGAAAEQKSFEELRLGHSTPGGLNQQLFDVFTAEGGMRALEAGLATVYERVRDR